jgi:hypothetical protein
VPLFRRLGRPLSRRPLPLSPRTMLLPGPSLLRAPPYLRACARPRSSAAVRSSGGGGSARGPNAAAVGEVSVPETCASGLAASPGAVTLERSANVPRASGGGRSMELATSGAEALAAARCTLAKGACPVGDVIGVGGTPPRRSRCAFRMAYRLVPTEPLMLTRLRRFGVLCGLPVPNGTAP